MSTFLEKLKRQYLEEHEPKIKSLEHGGWQGDRMFNQDIENIMPFFVTKTLARIHQLRGEMLDVRTKIENMEAQMNMLEFGFPCEPSNASRDITEKKGKGIKAKLSALRNKNIQKAETHPTAEAAKQEEDALLNFRNCERSVFPFPEWRIRNDNSDKDK